MGLPNIQQLREDGVPVIAFDTTMASKAQIIQRMRLAFEQRSFKWLDVPWATHELEAYEMKVTPLGHVTYGAPEGLHDDGVIARASDADQGADGELQPWLNHHDSTPPASTASWTSPSSAAMTWCPGRGTARATTPSRPAAFACMDIRATALARDPVAHLTPKAEGGADEEARSIERSASSSTC